MPASVPPAATVAVVTGGASGIGRATAERFVATGGAAVIFDLDRADTSWAEGNDRFAVFEGDVTSAADNAAAVALAVERFGRIDASVLNAGIPKSGDLLTLPIEELDLVLSVNVKGVALGVRAAVPAMRAQGHGAFVITASVSGLGGDPGMWPYNASKGAAVNLARSLAVELGGDNIRVNAVCPGPTITGMTSRLIDSPVEALLRRNIPMQRWGRAEEVANVIAFLASRDASFVNGAIVPVDGGVTANTGQFLPREVPRAD